MKLMTPECDALDRDGFNDIVNNIIEFANSETGYGSRQPLRATFKDHREASSA